MTSLRVLYGIKDKSTANKNDKKKIQQQKLKIYYNTLLPDISNCLVHGLPPKVQNNLETMKKNVLIFMFSDITIEWRESMRIPLKLFTTMSQNKNVISAIKYITLTRKKKKSRHISPREKNHDTRLVTIKGLATYMNNPCFFKKFLVFNIFFWVALEPLPSSTLLKRDFFFFFFRHNVFSKIVTDLWIIHRSESFNFNHLFREIK